MLEESRLADGRRPGLAAPRASPDERCFGRGRPGDAGSVAHALAVVVVAVVAGGACRTTLGSPDGSPGELFDCDGFSDWGPLWTCSLPLQPASYIVIKPVSLFGRTPPFTPSRKSTCLAIRAE